MQGFDMITDRREHAPDLVVAAFDQGDTRSPRRQWFDQGRCQRRGLGFQHQRATAENRRLVTA